MKTISVDANLFENGAKKLRFRLKTGECGQGLNTEYIGPFSFFFCVTVVLADVSCRLIDVQAATYM